MNLLKHSREQLGLKQDQMDAIRSKCELENRTRTPEEKTQWEKLKGECETLEGEITFLAQSEASDTRTATRQKTKDADEDRTYLDVAETVSIISSKTKLARQDEKPGIGVGELIAARLRGPKTDEEKRALDTSLDAAGGISTSLSRDFWDRTRQQSALFRAGAKAVDYERSDAGNFIIPVISGNPTVSWKVENNQANLVDPTFTSHPMDFETLFCAIQVSNEQMQDGGQLFAKMIETSLTNAFALEIDRAGLVGTGVDPEPLGLSGMGINEFSMGTNGQDIDSYAPLVGATRMLLDDGLPLSEVGPFIMAPRAWQDLNLLTSTTENQPLLLPRGISDIPWIVANTIPINQTKGSATDATTIFGGNWNEFIVGFRLHLKIKFFEQPLGRSFATLITASARVDYAAMNPSHFVKITGITGADDSLT